jgi:hypothetical protein
VVKEVVCPICFAVRGILIGAAGVERNSNTDLLGKVALEDPGF